MKKNMIALFLRISIIIVGLFGIVMCVFMYPFAVSLNTYGLMDVEPATIQQLIRSWVQLSFYWIASIPCFIILIIIWKISIIIKKDDLFSNNIVNLINIVIYTLFIDLTFFLVGNVIFLILRWRIFNALYFMLIILGLVIISFFWIASEIIKKGIEYKEVVEGTI